MSEVLTDSKIIKLAWKSFDLDLELLKRDLSNLYDTFDGLFATRNFLNLCFTEEVSEDLKNNIVQFYSLINESTWQSEKQSKYTKLLGDQAQLFGQNLMSKFRGDNILMGITQAGKSGALLSVMSERIDINQDGFPISLKESIETGTLYEAIKLVEYHIQKAQNGNYDGLAPFLNEERLLKFKTDILEYLGG